MLIEGRALGRSAPQGTKLGPTSETPRHHAQPLQEVLVPLAVLAFARLVDLVGALAAGAGAVAGDESARLVHPRRLPALPRRLRPPGGERQAEAEAVSIRAGAAADRARCSAPTSRPCCPLWPGDCWG